MAIKRYKGKKSLKQPDEFITFSSKLLQHVIQHKTKFIYALAGIVFVVLTISALAYFSRKAEDRSLLLLNQAMARYESVQVESDLVTAYNIVKEDLEAITDTYKNKAGGKLANFYLAGCSFAAGDFQQAETLYQKSVSDFSGIVPFEALAKSGLGYCLEQQGNREAAAEIFSNMPDSADSLMGDEILFALGRQYAAIGKIARQMKTAEKLVETYPQSIYINILKEKFPDLDNLES